MAVTGKAGILVKGFSRLMSKGGGGRGGTKSARICGKFDDALCRTGLERSNECELVHEHVGEF